MKMFRVTFLIGLSLLVFSCSSGYVSRKALPLEPFKYTLLVLNFDELDDEDVSFGNVGIDSLKTHKFLEKENKRLKQLNHRMENTLKHYYSYDYFLIDRDDINEFDSTTCRYVLDHRLVKVLSKKGKDINGGFYTYVHNFYDRITGKVYRDINLYSKDRWYVIKSILAELESIEK